MRLNSSTKRNRSPRNPILAQMPFRSKAQRRFLFAKEPKVAKRWAKETPKGKKLPERLHPAVKLGMKAFKSANRPQ